MNDQHPETYDSRAGNTFVVHKPNDSTRTFHQSNRGLYYHDTSLQEDEQNNHDNNGTVLVSTVAGNARSYSNADYAHAVLARKVQKIIGHPSTQDFIKIVDKHFLPNFPINCLDTFTAEHIFGKDLGSLKGKPVCHQPPAVNINKAAVPTSILKQYQQIIMAGDLMYINKVPFFMSISQHLCFGTAQHLMNQEGTMILQSTKQIQQVYLQGRYKLTHLLVDGQFEPLWTDLAAMGIENVVSNDEHVPEIE